MKLTHRLHICLIIFSFIIWYHEFTEVRQELLHFDSIMNSTHYESISVTWAVQMHVGLIMGLVLLKNGTRGFSIFTKLCMTFAFTLVLNVSFRFA